MPGSLLSRSGAHGVDDAHGPVAEVRGAWRADRRGWKDRHERADAADRGWPPGSLGRVGNLTRSECSAATRTRPCAGRRGGGARCAGARTRRTGRRVAVRQHRQQHAGPEGAVSAVGRRARQEAHGRQQQGQSGRALPADGHHADERASLPAQDHPDAERGPADLRGVGHDRPRSVSGRPAAAEEGRRRALVERLLGRPLGRRHARRRDDRPDGRRLARRPRQPADERGEDDRAVPPSEVRSRSSSKRRSTIRRRTRSRSRRRCSTASARTRS